MKIVRNIGKRRLGLPCFTISLYIAFCFVFALSVASIALATETKLNASNASENQLFGFGVDINENTAIIGAVGSLDTDESIGSAYIFRHNGTLWVEEAILTSSDIGDLDSFGQDVLIRGNMALVGAMSDDSDTGAVYVFKYNGTTWVEEDKLTASDAAPNSLFGSTMSVSGDVLVVGAYDDNSAYVFRFNGATWVEEAKLTASGASVFAYSVSNSGNKVLVGAVESNSAYVFKYNGTTWVEEDELTASEPAEYFGLGTSLCGETAMVGAMHDDASAGSVYVFKFNGTTWVEEEKLTASDAVPGDRFGQDISLNGNLAVIGAYHDDGETGSAYIFKYNGTNWVEETKLIASDRDYVDYFGWRVSMDDGRVLIGAHNDDDTASRSGSAYIYEVLTVVNDLVSLKPDRLTYSTTSDTSGCPDGFVGKFSFDARLTNTSSDTLSILMCKCTTLTNGNLMHNADCGPDGEGGTLTIPMTGGYSDGELSPGESVGVHFEICLKKWKWFKFFVDVLGVSSMEEKKKEEEEKKKEEEEKKKIEEEKKKEEEEKKKIEKEKKKVEKEKKEEEEEEIKKKEY